MGSTRVQAPPPPPDYQAIAREQAQMQADTAMRNTWADRPDIRTPFGSITWTTDRVQDPATGQYVTRWRQNVELNPEQQRALAAQQRLMLGRSELAESLINRARDSFSQPLDFSSLPQGGRSMQSTVDGISAPQLAAQLGGASAYTSAAGDALYQQARSRLDPQFQQRQSDLEASLLARGISRDSEAWQREMGKLERARTDAYNDAIFRAAQLSGAEAQRMQSMDMQALGFSNAAQQQNFANQLQLANVRFGQQLQANEFNQHLRQQALNELILQRQLPINEINAILHGQQIQLPNQALPTFNRATPAPGIDLMGAAQADMMNAYNLYNQQMQAAQARQNQIWGTIGTIASIAAMAYSDRTLKRNIERVGRTRRGTPLYLYEMHGTLRLGVLAQEAPRDAVRDVGGLLAVDYTKV